MCFGRICRLQKLFCTDIDLTEQEFSSLERDVNKLFIIKTANSPWLFNCSLEHMKPKVNIFDGKKKSAISTSGFPDK